ncbi:MAG: C39 family peptidase [Patescibacteria group bacterium]
MIYYDNVPFYSQFQDIPQVEWQSSACGIASMAMVMEFYKPKSVSVSNLLLQALDLGAYKPGIGWKHKELSALAGLYGLSGKNYDYMHLDNQTVFGKFKDFMKVGPVIVSIHNKFNPKATLGHIVVVTGMENGMIFYHDPASGNKIEKKISEADFLKGWKRRFIVVRAKTPVEIAKTAI